MSHTLQSTAVAAALGSCVLGLAIAAPASAAPEGDRAMVSVFHGVPGMTVDVYAGDKELIPNFKPGTLTKPMPLAAGSYDLKVYPDGADPQQDAPAIEKTVKVPAGSNATVAAHLSADGKPQLTAFVNDTSKVDAGRSRLTVRHVAAAPAVDVRANEKAVFTDLTNPNEMSAIVNAGTISADVTLAGTNDVAIGPADLTLKEGTSNVVYAWGSAEDKNLALKVQTLPGMHSAPGGVEGGAGSTQAGTNSAAAWLAGSAGAAALVAGALALQQRRRAAAASRH